MQALRLVALFTATLAVSWLSAETVRNPTKRAGAGPLFQIRRGEVWGYMDRTGKVVIAPRFNDVRDFFHGLAGVLVGKKWGYVDVRGKLVISAQFDEVRDFLDDLAPVRIGRKWGYIDTSGRMAIEPRFQAAGEFHEGLARVHFWDKVSCSSGQYTSETASERAFHLLEDDESDLPSCFPVGGRFGFIDKSGRLVIEPRFFVAQDFSEGLAAVRVEESTSSKYGYIDRSGTLVIEPSFNQAEPFSEGLAAVETSARVVGNRVVDIAWGFIDHSGKSAIPAKYQFAGSFSEGMARVAFRLGMGYIDRDGKMVIAPRFSQAWDFSEGLAVACIKECVYIDRSGTPVIRRPGAWWPFSDGLAVLGMHDQRVYIDKRGRDVAPYDADQ